VARRPGWLRKPADVGAGRNVSVARRERRRVKVLGMSGRASIVASLLEAERRAEQKQRR